MRPFFAAKLVDAVEAPRIGRYDARLQVTVDAADRPIVGARMLLDTVTEAERDPGDPADPPDARLETITKVANDPADPQDLALARLETETRVTLDPDDAGLVGLETATKVVADPGDMGQPRSTPFGGDDLATGVVAY
jgi:hypothetical protein